MQRVEMLDGKRLEFLTRVHTASDRSPPLGKHLPISTYASALYSLNPARA